MSTIARKEKSRVPSEPDTGVEIWRQQTFILLSIEKKQSVFCFLSVYSIVLCVHWSLLLAEIIPHLVNPNSCVFAENKL